MPSIIHGARTFCAFGFAVFLFGGRTVKLKNPNLTTNSSFMGGFKLLVARKAVREESGRPRPVEQNRDFVGVSKLKLTRLSQASPTSVAARASSAAEASGKNYLDLPITHNDGA